MAVIPHHRGTPHHERTGERMAKHTKGSLTIHHEYNLFVDKRGICNTGGYNSNVNPEAIAEENKANAERLCAAWNFCDTFPTEAIGGVTLREIVEVLAFYASIPDGATVFEEAGKPARALLDKLRKEGEG
jgi:hypothetical protein